MDWTDVEMELCATGQEQLAQWTQDEVQQMHGLLLWALYHHQGGSSPVGQPIRRALGIGQHEHMTAEQIRAGSDAVAKVMTPLPFNAGAQRAAKPSDGATCSVATNDYGESKCK